MGSLPLRPEPEEPDALRARYLEAPSSLPLGLAALDATLPDAGLPRGAVIEVASLHGLGRATQLGLWACAAAQRESGAWCAWIDPGGSLYAPGVVRAGVDLDRLLVVRPEPDELARIAVRVAASGVFAVVVIDRAGVPGSMGAPARQKTRWPIVVRRLALAAEKADTTILLLSSLHLARAELLPVAMRLELSHPARDRLGLRVARDRRGRAIGPFSIPLLQAG